MFLTIASMIFSENGSSTLDPVGCIDLLGVGI